VTCRRRCFKPLVLGNTTLLRKNTLVHQRLPIIITMCTPLVYGGSIQPRGPAVSNGKDCKKGKIKERSDP